MYEYSEKKNKYVNTILILAVVFIVIEVVFSIDWYNLLGLRYTDALDTYITVSNRVFIVLSLIASICTIIILYFLKKLRERRRNKEIIRIHSMVQCCNIVDKLSKLLFFVFNR